MIIKNPIFILGTARSGTSILYRTFIKHKDTGYLEHYSNIFFDRPWMFKLIPTLNAYRKLRYGISRPKQTEGKVWNRFYHHLEHLDETHTNDEIKNYYHSVIKAELKAFKVTRFVNKNPKHSLRIKWLNEMFPDAYYVLITRDPKPVVSSFRLKIENYNKVRPWDTDNAWNQIVEKFGKNKSTLEACIGHFKFVRETMLKDLPIIKDRIIEIEYKKFVNNPRDELKRLYDFVGLQWYDKLEKTVPEKLELRNDDKWKKLPENEITILEKAFPD